jgi:predicted RNA-binding protein with PIN domain
MQRTLAQPVQAALGIPEGPFVLRAKASLTGDGRFRWLVDGMNVIGSRPDRWWLDRDGAMRRLAALLERFARATGDAVTVVFDARPREQIEADSVEVVFAPERRRDAADDEIVRILDHVDEPEAVRVVTSDIGLATRAEARGAEVVPAGAFRHRLDG